jgi:putative ABC transport system permease protein
MLRLLVVLAARRPALRRGRALLSVLGIALGVGLGFGVHLVNSAAVADVAAAVRELAGGADLEVRGGRSGFPESLYPQVARVQGVAWVHPVLELEAGVAGGERTLRIVGVDAVRTRRLDLLQPDAILLSAAAAREFERYAKDGRLDIVVGARRVSLKIAGTAEQKGLVALADISTAQWRLERLGELNRLEVGLAQGADPQAVRRAIAALLPAGTVVAPVEDFAAASAYPSRAYRVNMNVLAMVALFTGGFLVFSAQSLEMARRRGEHALLRVLGLTRGGLARVVLAEAAVLGAGGALAGLFAGYGIAYAALATIGADLGAGALPGHRVQLQVSVLAALGYFLAGLAVALAGAMFSAADASRTAPARALKAGDEQAVLARMAPAWPGAALLAAGAGFSQLGPVSGIPIFGYASVACILVGCVALMPRLSRALLERLPLTRHVPYALALAQLRGAPGQSAISLAAIVASFSLMAAMAIMVNSFRDSLDEWLQAVLPAELYLRTAEGGDTAHLPPELESAVRSLPHFSRAQFLRTGRVVMEPLRPALPLIARDGAQTAFPIVGKRYARQAGDPPPLWVSEAVADLYAWAAGDRVDIPLQGRTQPFVVAGVFRDYARQHGAFLVDRSDYVALTGDRRVNDAALWLAPGVTPAQAMEALRVLPGGERLEIAEPGEIRALSLRIFDRSFAATYAVEAVAMLVGLFGLSSSLGSIVLARRREFGVLRHLGVTRSQVAVMLAAEGGLLALLGACAGLVAGAAISLVLVHVVNRQSFHWGMELHLPWAFLSALVAVLVVLAVATAVLAGREAMGMGPVRAVREDW